MSKPESDKKLYRIQLFKGAGATSFTCPTDGKRKVAVGGNVFLSSSPYHQRWPEKFREVPESVPLTKNMIEDNGYIPELPGPESPKKPPDPIPQEGFDADSAGLDGLTIEEIKKLAAEEELDVDLTKAKTAADAAKVIKAKYGKK